MWGRAGVVAVGGGCGRGRRRWRSRRGVLRDEGRRKESGKGRRWRRLRMNEERPGESVWIGVLVRVHGPVRMIVDDTQRSPRWKFVVLQRLEAVHVGRRTKEDPKMRGG